MLLSKLTSYVTAIKIPEKDRRRVRLRTKSDGRRVLLLSKKRQLQVK